MFTLSLEALTELSSVVKTLGAQKIAASLFWTENHVKLYLDAQGAALARFSYQRDEEGEDTGSALFEFANFAKVLSAKPKSLIVLPSKKTIGFKLSTGTTIYCPIERDSLEEIGVFETTSVTDAQREQGLLDATSRGHILKHSKLFEMDPEAPLLIDVAAKGKGTVCATNGKEAVWLEFKTSQNPTQMTLPYLALRLASVVPNVDVYILPQLLLLRKTDGSLDMAVAVLDPLYENHTSEAILNLFKKEAALIDLTDSLRMALTSVAMVSDTAHIIPHPKKPKLAILEGFQNNAKSAKHVLTAVNPVGLFSVNRVSTALSIIRDATVLKQTEAALLVTAPGVGAAFLYSSEASQ